VKRGALRHLFVAAITLAAPISASAATVVSFVAVTTGDTLVVSNPQGSPVTGDIRLIPDVGAAAAPLVPFSIPAQGSQSFPNVLASFGPIASPAIVAVESSDTVRLSSISLRVAYPERPVTLPVRFNPSAASTGTLVLGILNGLVRVDIFEPTSGTPLATRIFNSAGEQVTRLRYVDFLPAGMAISDGVAVMTPLSGQAVGVSVNAPTRRRAVGPGGASQPPVISVTGEGCEFATGVRARVSPEAAATYRWSLLNATAQGTVTGNTLDLALGSRGYATLMLDTAGTPAPSTAETTIRIEGRPLVESIGAPPVTLGQEATISWALGGGTPTSQTLTSADFPPVSLPASATSYAYRPSTAGTKTYTLSADNACGGSSESGFFEVSVACTPPIIASFEALPSSIEFGTVTCLHFTIQDASAWTLTSMNGNFPAQRSGTGSGTFTVLLSIQDDRPDDTITLSAANSCGRTVRTLSVTVRNESSLLAKNNSPVCMGGTLSLTIPAIAGATAYKWVGPNGFSSTDQNPVIPNITSAAAGGYQVNIMVGCDSNFWAYDETKVTVNPNPTATAVASNPIICKGASADISANLTGTVPFTVHWSNGNIQTISSGTVATLHVTPAFTTTYSVNNVTDANGCTAAGTGSVTVTVTNPVITSLTASPSTVPGGGTSTITGNYTNGMSWTMSSSLSNSLSTTSGSGASPAVVTYTRDIALGADTITFTVTDACGNTTTQTTTIN
jgi:hypothetical protein